MIYFWNLKMKQQDALYNSIEFSGYPCFIVKRNGKECVIELRMSDSRVMSQQVWGN